MQKELKQEQALINFHVFYALKKKQRSKEKVPSFEICRLTVKRRNLAE